MDQFTTTDARKVLSDLVSRVEYGKEAVGLVRRGRVVAVLVPVEDYRLIEAEVDRRLAARAERARAKDDRVAHDEVRRRAALADREPDVERGRRLLAESDALEDPDEG